MSRYVRKSSEQTLTIIERSARFLPQSFQNVREHVSFFLVVDRVSVFIYVRIRRSEILNGGEDGKRLEDGFGQSPLNESRRIFSHDGEEVSNERHHIL